MYGKQTKAKRFSRPLLKNGMLVSAVTISSYPELPGHIQNTTQQNINGFRWWPYRTAV